MSPGNNGVTPAYEVPKWVPRHLRLSEAATILQKDLGWLRYRADAGRLPVLQPDGFATERKVQAEELARWAASQDLPCNWSAIKT